MSCILHIETSTEVCSVAVSQDGACIYSKEDFEGPSHAVVLGVYVDEALSFIDSHAIPLDAVAVSCGPGSYRRIHGKRHQLCTSDSAIGNPHAGSNERTGVAAQRTAR